jgi:ABC-type nitrate/sulfonate/bicarbonate transport system substrate-binding protein
MAIDRGRRHFIAGAAALGGAALFAPRVSAQNSSKPLDVVMINSSANAQLAFEALLKRQGYLEEFGLNATTIHVADGSKAMAALISGDADVCMTSGFGQVLPGVERGAPIKVIAGSNLLTAQGVLTNRPDVKSIADLKGKNIGTGPIGALEHQLMVAVLVKHGVDLDSVKFVNVGNTADIFRSISGGLIDAGPVNVDVYSRLSGNLRTIGDFWTELPDYPYLGSFTSAAAIANKREVLIRTLAANCKMYRYLLSPEAKEPYIQAYVQAVGGEDAATAAARQWQFFYDTQAYAKDLVIPDKSLTFLQDLNIKTNVQKTALPLDAFSDMSLAREALKRLG